jgi:hypothetical protein
VKVRFGCFRFHRLWDTRDERDLTSGEERFIENHVAACHQCSEFAETASTALNLLREAALEPEVSLSFDDRVIRKVRVQTVRESLGYWSPALVGGLIACVAVFATLQIAATPVQLREANLPIGEARREIKNDGPLPSLILHDELRLEP